MVRKVLTAAMAGMSLLFVGAAAQAQEIVGDSLTYAPGDIANASGGTGWPNDGNHNWFTGASSPADQVTADGLKFSAEGGTLSVSGNKLTTAGSDSGAFRNLPADYGGDINQTIWVSFLASNANSANQGGYAGLSLIDAYMNNGNYIQQENFFIGQVNASGQYGFVNQTPSNSNSAPFLTAVATDTQTHLLVTRFDFTASGSTEVSLYVDPVPGVDPTNAPDAIEDYTDGFVFNQIRFQSGSTSNAAYNFDELRVGDNYVDVAPAAAPEPSGLAVCAFGGLAIVAAGLRLRARRRV